MTSGLASTRSESEAGLLINIDNGGTLTDICVIAANRLYRTKTITTPYDLSRCLIDGLSKVSQQIFGKSDLTRLLQSTDHLRYSTTQGTNALVERKGPRLGLLLGGELDAAVLAEDPARSALFATLVANRMATIDPSGSDTVLIPAVVGAINGLAAVGANRIVIAMGGRDGHQAEMRLKRMLLRAFPPHLLGAIPLLYSHELAADEDDGRRTWTALFNAFLHPAMERFLYRAEQKLREATLRDPLLIFRNDGQSARVAKTIAIKTYGSGPRGGAEGARALAAHYGFRRLVSMDVGGTTTDLGLVENGQIAEDPFGAIESIAISFPLCRAVSAGVGGSSIIRVEDGRIVVGPESVGAEPGPACFGLGGRLATITDSFLLQGLLDPDSYFGGEMKIDTSRARAAIAENVAGPLGVSEQAAAAAMEAAWVAAIAENLSNFATLDSETVLTAFGGAGPFVVCRVADAVGVDRVLIPAMAAVFSAYGIGFADVGHRYDATPTSNDAAAVAACWADLVERARRGMFAEGFDLADCRLDGTLTVTHGERQWSIPVSGTEDLPAAPPDAARLELSLAIRKDMPHPPLRGNFNSPAEPAIGAGTRRVLLGESWVEVPLYRAEDQPPGASAAGPAVLEEAFYTCRVDSGWQFEVNLAGDVLLTRQSERRG